MKFFIVTVKVPEPASRTIRYGLEAWQPGRAADFALRKVRNEPDVKRKRIKEFTIHINEVDAVDGFIINESRTEKIDAIAKKESKKEKTESPKKKGRKKMFLVGSSK